MKKVGYSLFFTIVLLLPLTVTVLAAADVRSKAIISFYADYNPTDPKDPDDPGEPGKPGSGTGMNGPLSLDYVPQMEFGSNLITGKIETYGINDSRAYIQISDKRGNGAGWRLSVKIGYLQNDSLSYPSLIPARITFRNPSLITAPTNQSNPPHVFQNISLISGAAEQKLMGTSNRGEGMGTWLLRYFPSSEAEKKGYNDAITLTLDTSNVITGVYSADIFWILSDAP